MTTPSKAVTPGNFRTFFRSAHPYKKLGPFPASPSPYAETSIYVLNINFSKSGLPKGIISRDFGDLFLTLLNRYEPLDMDQVYFSFLLRFRI
jgi:hypothetical protein